MFWFHFIVETFFFQLVCLCYCHTIISIISSWTLGESVLQRELIRPGAVRVLRDLKIEVWSFHCKRQTAVYGFPYLGLEIRGR